jgi:hypothetical protein|tara:strand:+ start:264 stop:395 length:132 start_codon:yes stop_codon:yes gene_type:complete
MLRNRLAQELDEVLQSALAEIFPKAPMSAKSGKNGMDILPKLD